MITAAPNISEEWPDRRSGGGRHAGGRRPPVQHGGILQFEASVLAYGIPSAPRGSSGTRGYNNAKIWAQAVEAASTTDGTAVAQALRSGTFHVFGVEARFDEQGNVQGPLGEAAVWVWQGGKPVPLQL
jgi:ABC-type branched-subunit amino acid transport system substrate-binding protein